MMTRQENARHIAQAFLDRSGYEIIDNDWKHGIVVWERKTDTMVFCVVKSHERVPSRLRTFPNAKCRKAFWRQVTNWRRQNKWGGNYRVDAVHVCFPEDAKPSIFHRENVKYTKGN